jgi:phosphate-selective porin OprO/OprP
MLFVTVVVAAVSALCQDTLKSSSAPTVARPTVKVRGYVQADGQFFLQDHQEVSTNTFLLRRARIVLEGDAGKLFGFYLMPDFGDGKTVIYDARLDVRISSALRFRIGKFKPPVGLERLQSATDLSFVFRAAPTALVPNRDIGIQASGEGLEGRLTYAVGVFNGVLDGGTADADVDDNKEVAGRVFAEPWKSKSGDALSGLGIGIAGTYGNQLGTASSPNVASYRTGGGLTFFRYLSDGTVAGTVMANGQKYRITPQAYYYYRSFGLMVEYALSSQEIRRGASTHRSRAYGWQCTALLALTGESLSYRGLQPNEPFDPETGTAGAFELAARFARWGMNEGAFPTFADPRSSMQAFEGWSVALHWYLSANVKVIVDYDQIVFRSVAPGQPKDPEKAVLFRVQVNM